MKKAVLILLSVTMLLVSCAKQTTVTTEQADSYTENLTETIGDIEPSEAPTEPTEETEPSSEATEPSSEEPTDTIEAPEPDPYAEIKTNPLPLLDITLGEFEDIYGELEIKEYFEQFELFKADEAYTPVLDMYFETAGGLFRSAGIRREHLIRGIVVTRLDSLGVEAGMSSDEIDLSGWDLTVGTSVVVSGEMWYEPAVDASGAIRQYTDDYKSSRTLDAFKEMDGYWYNIYFLMPEEYQECDYNSSDSFWWRNEFAEEVRDKKRSLIVSRIEVRKKGTLTH